MEEIIIVMMILALLIFGPSTCNSDNVCGDNSNTAVTVQDTNTTIVPTVVEKTIVQPITENIDINEPEPVIVKSKKKEMESLKEPTDYSFTDYSDIGTGY